MVCLKTENSIDVNGSVIDFYQMSLSSTGTSFGTVEVLEPPSVADR
jgi:hypothetical protein